MQRLTRARAALLVLLLSPFLGVEAQSTPRDTSVAAVVQRFRDGDDSPDVMTVLRQVRSNQSAARRNAVADSLLSMCLRSTVDEASLLLARRALRALYRAGQTAEGAGGAYGGADARLMVVSLRGSGGIRASALFYLTRSADTSAALRHLGEVIRLNDSLAAVAVQMLATEMGPRGLASLREAYTRDEAVNQEARGAIEAIALSRGWTR